MTSDSFHSENALFEKLAFNRSIKGAAALLYFSQQGVARKLLHKLKYEHEREVGSLLGGMLCERASALSIDFIIPVPVHKKKKLRRGYNQSTEIAKAISEKLLVDVREDVISRTVLSTSQTKKSKVQRWRDLENVYSEADESVRGCKVLVVDDVITTGATVGMLCDRLVEKGVAEIFVGAIARGQ